MLVPNNAIIENLNLGVFILQCLQNELITKEQAKDMLFINNIGVK